MGPTGPGLRGPSRATLGNRKQKWWGDAPLENREVAIRGNRRRGGGETTKLTEKRRGVQHWNYRAVRRRILPICGRRLRESVERTRLFGKECHLPSVTNRVQIFTQIRVSIIRRNKVPLGNDFSQEILWSVLFFESFFVAFRTVTLRKVIFRKKHGVYCSSNNFCLVASRLFCRVPQSRVPHGCMKIRSPAMNISRS